KRVDVQYPDPEVASRIYGRLGVDILTTPTTSGRDVEVEPPRKRYIQATNQAVFHNTGTTRTTGRVVTNGVARPLLNNEQMQQFINTTVLPNGRSVTSTEPVNRNVTSCTVYPSLPRTRVQLQTEPANVKPELTLNELRSGQTLLPWVSIQQQTQETILQRQTEYSVQQIATNCQGHIHPSAQNALAVHFLNPTLTQAELQQPISANELTLPRNIEVQGFFPTTTTNEWFNRTRLQVPTDNSVPVTSVYDQTIHQPTQLVQGVRSNCSYNGAYSPVMTPTPNVTTPGLSADYPQRFSAGHPESWSLNPQSVPTFVAPMEAQRPRPKCQRKRQLQILHPTAQGLKGVKIKCL
ncbi:uncharacterized protein LOC134267951, partial [Saccostrea cucullata]|uniref:uncharacterized protein LOC134229605 n=1 Tax=Saccostrea cuccullata TaxID=36930 RepID=UPI002ED29416